MFTEADHELARRAATQHSIFTREDAAESGLTDDQIEYRVTNCWQRVYEGVYRAPGSPSSWRGALFAVCRIATTPVGISHRSAGALYALPGGDDRIVELTCRRWLRAQGPGLVVHEQTRIDERDITEIDGIPVVKPELVVLQMAGLRPFPRYVEMMIQAARRKRLITFASTEEMFDRHARRGVRGVRVMRAVLDAWDPEKQPTESEMETLLLQVLSDAGFRHVVPQYEVCDRNGVFIARADVALPDLRVVIEYDSMQEHSDEFQLTRDARRRNRIVAAGWRVLSARYRDVDSGGVELLDAIAGVARSA
jgi:very-short-patch-repair endonuclease